MTIPDLERSFDSLEKWLVFVTGLVAIGLLVEYTKSIFEFLVGLFKWATKRGSWPAITATVIGGLLITVGVASEGCIEYRSWRVETDLRTANQAKVAELTIQAGDAAKNAKAAHDQANAVASEADAISDHLKTASVQLDDLRRDTLALIPRARLLKHAQSTFVEALKPFPRQKVGLVFCGPDDPERFSYEMELLALLDKAGWVTTGRSWPACPLSLGAGNEIFFVHAPQPNMPWAVEHACVRSPFSIDKTKGIYSASEALCDDLSSAKIYSVAYTESPLGSVAGGEHEIRRARDTFAMGIPGGPAELALKEPSTIFVLIGPQTFSYFGPSSSAHSTVRCKPGAPCIKSIYSTPVYTNPITKGK